MEQTTTHEKKQAIVGILTPYLTEKIEELRKTVGVIEAQGQIQGHAYNEKALQYTPILDTPHWRVHAMTSEYMAKWTAECIEMGCREDIAMKPSVDFAIAGSTRAGENEVRVHKYSGIPIARFSIFYGGNSGYTGYAPEETGYSFDIPKDFETVQSLITNEAFLEAIVNREENDVRQAIQDINTQLHQPILITSYLTKALHIKK